MVSAISTFITIIILRHAIAFTTPALKSPPPPPHTIALYSTPSSNIEIEGRTINVLKLDPSTYGSTSHSNDQIMQLASFRNDLQSPQMTIDSQQSRRDSADNVSDAIDGIKNGLGVGLLAGLATGITTLVDGSVREAVTAGATNFLVPGLAVGGLLGANNYAGNKVYVMEMKEAINRLTVDYVASVKVGQDVGFAAYAAGSGDAEDFMDGRFRGTCGMVGCVDCQLRNSEISTAVEPETFKPRTFPGLPSHVHLKNMAVDKELRRKGVAMMLIRAVEDWGRASTDAEMLTLEVDESNTGAVKLYESAGFVKDEKKRTERIGRFFMSKSILS